MITTKNNLDHYNQFMNDKFAEENMNDTTNVAGNINMYGKNYFFLFNQLQTLPYLLSWLHCVDVKAVQVPCKFSFPFTVDKMLSGIP